MEQITSNGISKLKKTIGDIGDKAIPILLDLLDKHNDDLEMIDLVVDYIAIEAENPYPYVKNYILEKIELFEKDRESVQDYIFQLSILMSHFGDMAKEEDEKMLLKCLEMYDNEEEQLVVYEGLAKIGKAEKYMDYFKYLIFEDDYKKKYVDEVGYILACIGTEESIKEFIKLLREEWLPEENKKYLEQFFQMFNLQNLYESDYGYQLEERNYETEESDYEYEHK